VKRENGPTGLPPIELHFDGLLNEAVSAAYRGDMHMRLPIALLRTPLLAVTGSAWSGRSKDVSEDAQVKAFHSSYIVLSIRIYNTRARIDIPKRKRRSSPPKFDAWILQAP